MVCMYYLSCLMSNKKLLDIMGRIRGWLISSGMFCWIHYHNKFAVNVWLIFFHEWSHAIITYFLSKMAGIHILCFALCILQKVFGNQVKINCVDPCIPMDPEACSVPPRGPKQQHFIFPRLPNTSSVSFYYRQVWQYSLWNSPMWLLCI